MSDVCMYEPVLYSSVMNKMKGLLYSIEYKDTKEPLAFTYRNIGERTGFDYKIVCNNNCKELTPFLLMHESGHIIFGHCKVDKTEEFLVKNKIKIAWKKIEKYFKDYDVNQVFQYFENYIYNIVMDWEVNSKLSSEPEIERYEKITNNFLGVEGKLCYPTREGYPEKKNWLEYITLITLDPDKFLKNMSRNNSNNGQSGQSSGKKGKQNSNGQSGQGTNSNQSTGLSEEQVKDIVSKMEKAFAEAQNKNKETSIEKMKDASSAASNFQSYGIGSGSGTSVEIKNNISFYSKNDKELEDIILSSLSKESTRNTKRDPVYYYNKNKYNSQVMYIKERTEVFKKKNNLCVLLDVSSSNDLDNINRFVNIFKNICKKLNKKCSLILWDTGLVAEYNSLDDEIKSFCGGCTDMSAGLKYIDDNKKYKKDTVFIVSDFCDNLNDWKFSRSIYGICWDKDGLENCSENYLSSYEEKEYFNHLFKKIIIDKGK